MLHHILECSPALLKKRLTALYILNALDIVFTFTLLKTDLFYEANFFMSPIVENALLSILIKLVIPALLIIYLLFELDGLIASHLKVGSICIHFVLLVYTAILFLHLYYTVTFLLL
jgi:hypothetical protein